MYLSSCVVGSKCKAVSGEELKGRTKSVLRCVSACQGNAGEITGNENQGERCEEGV